MSAPLVFLPIANEAPWSPDEFMTRAQLAHRWKCSKSQVDRWRKQKPDPLPFRPWPGRLVRIRVLDADAWMERQIRREERAA